MANPVLREYLVTWSPGDFTTTVFATDGDAAISLADAAIRADFDSRLGQGSWWVSGGEPVDMGDAVVSASAGETDGRQT